MSELLSPNKEMQKSCCNVGVIFVRHNRTGLEPRNSIMPLPNGHLDYCGLQDDTV